MSDLSHLITILVGEILNISWIAHKYCAPIHKDLQLLAPMIFHHSIPFFHINAWKISTGWCPIVS